ncbi:MAG: hypothetical protein DLM63_03490 [Solirubrobacterales bacterium]|nr:MAG: hypothetical protein DLM63_03490 [Solirubrobacterales bacterium]
MSPSNPKISVLRNRRASLLVGTENDRDARAHLRGIWPLSRRFEGLIGREPLRLAVRRAEEQSRA